MISHVQTAGRRGSVRAGCTYLWRNPAGEWCGALLSLCDSPLRKGSGSTERLDLRGLVMAYSAFLLIAVGRIGELVPGLGSLPLAKVAMGIALIVADC